MADHPALTHTPERRAGGMNGVLMLFLGVLGFAVAIWLFAHRTPMTIIPAVILAVLSALAVAGLYALQPNEAAAITLFGEYKGTDRSNGLRWVPFWYVRRKISLRVRNVTSEQLKVNDKRGNPIEIAANVVWRVADTGQALFDVDDYLKYVNIQIETGLRDIASHYAYDHGVDGEAEITLRADAEIIAEKLRDELNERVKTAGVSVDEARISHLAYSPEIAGAMLRRQQAQAILSARQLIVQGAVLMVESALEQLSERKVVDLDEERKAAMVSNLLVVLCGDRDAQPVLNTGTLYS